MSRIIKANMVNIGEEAHVINIPESIMFRQNTPDASYDEEEHDIEETVTPEELLQRAEQHAAEIINDAHAEAEGILIEATARMEQEKEAIYEEARQNGYKAGEQEAKKNGERIIEEANKTLASAREEKERLLRQIEPDAVSLIIETIEKLAGDIVKLNPQAILHIIKMGLDGISGAKELSVRVSPDDYETAEGLKDEIKAYVDSDTELSVIKDTSLSQGDCIIDTPIGSVDSSLNTQYANLKQDLIQIMKAGL